MSSIIIVALLYSIQSAAHLQRWRAKTDDFINILQNGRRRYCRAARTTERYYDSQAGAHFVPYIMAILQNGPRKHHPHALW